MKKQELIDKLKSASKDFSNVFLSVSEVVSMVEDLEEGSKGGMTEDKANILADRIVSAIEYKGATLIESFRIDAYSDGSDTVKIELEEADFDTYELKDIIIDKLRDFIEEEETSTVDQENDI